MADKPTYEELKQRVKEMEKEALESKRANEALRVSALAWQTLFDAVTDSVFLINSEGKILLCNKSTVNFLGKPINEIVGNNCWELVHATSEPIKGCPIVRMRETRRPESLELPVGDRVLYVATHPILDQDGNLASAVHIITDITERKRAEEALSKAHDELEIKTKSLKEINISMNVLLEKRVEDRILLEHNVLINVKKLIKPLFYKMRETELDDHQKTILSIIELNLDEITTPFTRKLSLKHLKLTPTEIKIANLIRHGMTTKKIAKLMNSSPRTIDTHRKNIRRKIGLKKKKENLRSYLLSIQ